MATPSQDVFPLQGDVPSVFVDFAFRVQGSTIPADHGYLVFAAVTSIVPTVHSDKVVGIHPVWGRLMGDRKLTLVEHSRLTFRLPASHIPDVLPLAGTRLDLAGSTLRVGTPETRALMPAPALYSRLVVIKGYVEPDEFLEAARRQASEYGTSPDKLQLIAQPHVPAVNAERPGGSRSPYLRRTLHIRDREIVGFAVTAHDLTPEESLALQVRGIGGRRRFGCGLFIPTRRRV